VVAAGLVLGLRVRKQRNGRIAFVTLDDRSGRVEVKAFEKTFERYRNAIAKDRVAEVQGKLGFDDYSDAWQITADSILDIDQARERFAKGLQIELRGNGSETVTVKALADSLGPYRNGRCRVFVGYERPDARVRIRLSEDWQVHPTDELLRRLRELPGAEFVGLVY
jgi:DNA polymerase-3 subunit alpha